MPAKLDSYKGTLTPSQVVEGMNAARRNATRLLTDARILFDAARYPSAAALAILSIEESGKSSVLRGVARSATFQDAKKEWKRYRSHTSKNVLWPLRDLVLKGAWKLEDLRTLFDPASGHPLLMDQVKQIALYTDCLGDARWSEPTHAIDEQLATSLIEAAESLALPSDASVFEIELWVKHFAGVQESDSSGSKKALRGWFYDMQASGLLAGEPTKQQITDWLGNGPD